MDFGRLARALTETDATRRKRAVPRGTRLPSRLTHPALPCRTFSCSCRSFGALIGLRCVDLFLDVDLSLGVADWREPWAGWLGRDRPCRKLHLALVCLPLVTPERFARFPWNILLLVHVVPCVVPLEDGVA